MIGRGIFANPYAFGTTERPSKHDLIRLLYTQLDRARAESRQLETEHQRLQVEKRAQATPLRVERIARDTLHMRTATPAITLYVNDSAPAAGAGGAP